jgi:hypothetical protein
LPESAAAPPEPATPAEKRTSLAHVDLVDEVEAPVMVGTPSNAGMLAKTAE